MTHIKFYDPIHTVYRDETTSDSFERLSRIFAGPNYCGCNESAVPGSNIMESDNEFTIKLALPGVDKNSIRIQHEKGYLTVQVEKTENPDIHENYTRREFDFSQASRTFRVGEKIDTEKITARYENGILTLQLPKKEAFVNKPAKTIEVE
jgi:HSP20 family protein